MKCNGNIRKLINSTPGHKRIWVTRPPQKAATCQAYLNMQIIHNMLFFCVNGSLAVTL